MNFASQTSVSDNELSPNRGLLEDSMLEDGCRGAPQLFGAQMQNVAHHGNVAHDGNIAHHGRGAQQMNAAHQLFQGMY